ncbi:bifunctional molybdenum cofactor biosynthesis protein MoaC/MoaB [Dyadobacter sp. Leaf189]|uniref:bifunctional molybdenum cofactor biosynthesis protein MoaC/MoaB n=1 Tax=Dyadobacter sp. Leaf189 TaxID=1736295 RepID=UPI0006F34EF6|nr:bifunctional molybdenum cofactor biosynthesis protein MoaC/MoaB [Dyadobacter sp. Leaf189]KQS24703.1 molybdenum cofactor biosynthesis protein MoaC [Dyadobacter sp. Leaf189]
MVDITHKTNTLRIAKAQAIVRVSKPETIEAIVNRTVPKGDVFEMAKAAGFLAVKKTPDLLPDCHPIPIEYTAVNYKIDGLEISIELIVKTIYKTGVEVEAMHGASVVALTMYDMLKPIDKGVEISNIRLLEKKGGKSDRKAVPDALKIAVMVCSDTIAAGNGEDKSGKKIMEKLAALKLETADYVVVPDDKLTIQQQILQWTNTGYQLILITGGTGLSRRDVTPEAVSELIDREIPGIAEAARSYGQERVATSMLSRSVAGFSGDSLVVTMPGSTGGVTEYMDALFPHILHVFSVLEGAKHE